ncbi:MAG: hypothetical protein D4R73_01880 [Deltaproteobacteria bacterium]|nr:MAG: hypothetical protein D4R73_01880 [Deltaproteobacteria bacterium]
MNFEAIIIGCITGFLSAFFGIGGSSVDTPVLRTFLDLPPLVALGTPLPRRLRAGGAAEAFLDFMKGRQAQDIYAGYGFSSAN